MASAVVFQVGFKSQIAFVVNYKMITVVHHFMAIGANAGFAFFVDGEIRRWEFHPTSLVPCPAHTLKSAAAFSVRLHFFVKSCLLQSLSEPDLDNRLARNTQS